MSKSVILKLAGAHEIGWCKHRLYCKNLLLKAHSTNPFRKQTLAGNLNDFSLCLTKRRKAASIALTSHCSPIQCYVPLLPSLLAITAGTPPFPHHNIEKDIHNDSNVEEYCKNGFYHFKILIIIAYHYTVSRL